MEMPTGFPTDQDRETARRLLDIGEDWALTGKDERRVEQVAQALATERRNAFNEGAVVGMRLTTSARVDVD